MPSVSMGSHLPDFRDSVLSTSLASLPTQINIWKMKQQYVLFGEYWLSASPVSSASHTLLISSSQQVPKLGMWGRRCREVLSLSQCLHLLGDTLNWYPASLIPESTFWDFRLIVFSSLYTFSKQHIGCFLQLPL